MSEQSTKDYQTTKPSVIGSLAAGTLGFIKGAIALGAIGAAVGTVIGAGLGAFGIGTSSMAAGAAFGAVRGVAYAALGAIIGGASSVMQYREAKGPDAQDIINVANISFAQGVEVGRNQNISEHAIEKLKEAQRTFQQTIAQQRAPQREWTI